MHPEPQSASAPGADEGVQDEPLLKDHVQLTTTDLFVKAGEAYFSPDSEWIIFQAVPVPAAEQGPDPFYSMYVAKLQRNGEGRVTGLDTPILISPPGSANTCGWFHPSAPYRVLFGSTLTRPSDQQKSGFQVGGRNYVWQFPAEMEIVTRTVPDIYRSMLPPGVEVVTNTWNPDAEKPIPVFSRPDYDAEGSWSKDGRFILYSHVNEEKIGDRPDADIWVFDTRTGGQTLLIEAPGYDGGPFFSPDGSKICYRSDRKGDDRLQLFVAALSLSQDGVPLGVLREFQLTDDGHVNWGPFWHPSGRFLVYGSSAVGHHNYELFAVEVGLDTPLADLKKARVTFAGGADVLPAFNADGSLLMWTSQRGPKGAGQEKSSSQLWIARFVGDPVK